MADSADYSARFRLDGRKVVVLGAGQGMGLQASLAVRALGASVLLVDISETRAQAAGELMGVPYLVADTTDRTAVAKLAVEAQTALGGVDGVIDIVGIADWEDLLGATDESIERMLSLNYRHAVYALQSFAPLMPAGSAFAFITSVSGVGGAPGQSSYGAAKAALIALIRSAAAELGPRGIRVNGVAPGVIHSERVDKGIFADPEVLARQERNVPLGRLGDPSEVGSALAFMLSDAASYVTGQNLVVDGGTGSKFHYLA